MQTIIYINEDYYKNYFEFFKELIELLDAKNIQTINGDYLHDGNNAYRITEITYEAVGGSLARTIYVEG